MAVIFFCTLLVFYVPPLLWHGIPCNNLTVLIFYFRFCDEHKWQNRRYNPDRHSIFYVSQQEDSDQSAGDTDDELICFAPQPPVAACRADICLTGSRYDCRHEHLERPRSIDLTQPRPIADTKLVKAVSEGNLTATIAASVLGEAIGEWESQLKRGGRFSVRVWWHASHTKVIPTVSVQPLQTRAVIPRKSTRECSTKFSYHVDKLLSFFLYGVSAEESLVDCFRLITLPGVNS